MKAEVSQSGRYTKISLRDSLRDSRELNPIINSPKQDDKWKKLLGM